MADFHYVITLQLPLPNGSPGWQTRYRAGVITAQPGATRDELFLSILDSVGDENFDARTASIAFFSLEPNDLGV